MEKEKNTKILCWNVNGIRAWSKKGCLEWVLTEKPDIFCFQETKAHPEQLEESLRNIPGYFAYFDHSKVKKGYSGVVVYTKEKPKKVDTDLYVNGSIDQEGSFLVLYFSNFVLINCYFPNGGGEPHRLEYKLNFYKAFEKYILVLKNSGLKVIFCGDINVAHTEIDIARPKENSNHVGFLPVERDWLSGLLDKGFIDSFRYFNPGLLNQYTWWDVKSGARNRNIGWRIDYVIVDESLKKNIVETKIYSEIYGSDHCPISITVKI